MKDLKEVVQLGISLSNALATALEDGKITTGDIFAFWPVALDIPDAVDGIDRALKELTDMSPEQMAELVQYVKEEFDIPQDNIESAIESAIEVIAGIFRTYVLCKKA